MAKNIGIITGGTVVVEGDFTVTSGDKSAKDTNIGIIATGGGNVVINGGMNVGGKKAKP